jgi:hypothetical protein
VQRLIQSVQRRAVPRIGSLVIVLITVAALVAPVALADKWGTARASGNGATVRPDDRSGVRGSGPTLLVATAALRPDDRSGVRGSGAISLAPPVAPVVTVQTEDASFQWGDAGIGAGVMFVAVMLVVGGIVLVARHRSARVSTV